MAVFREIEFYPPSGFVDRPWTDDGHPATDALARSSRRMCEAYELALDDEQLQGPYASLRFFSHPDPHAGSVRLAVDTGRPEGWESALLIVPQTVADLSAGDRGRLVLDLIHLALLELAPHRDWPVAAIERARDRVLAGGLTFEWASPWKSSPDRALVARVVFRLMDDGFGRASVEVRERKSQRLVARSEPTLAFSTLPAFKRSAKTLRWVGRSVEHAPWMDVERRGDVVSVDPEAAEVHPWPPTERDGDRGSPAIPPIALVPYGLREDDPAPGVDVYLGFGQDTDSDRVTLVDGVMFGSRIEIGISEGIASDQSRDAAEWLGGIPIEMWLQYEQPHRVDEAGETFGIKLRRLADRLEVDLVRDAGVFGRGENSVEDLRREIAEVVEHVLAAIRARSQNARRPA